MNLSDSLKTEIIPTKLYKFLSHDSENLTITGICKGNIKFSKIPDLNDSSEEYAYANFEEFHKSVKEIFGSECPPDVFEKLEKQVDLVDKIFPEKGLGKNKNAIMLHAHRMCGNNPELGRRLSQNEELFKKLESELAQIHKEILNKVGIFCLTDRLDYFPMWAHYADKARGFAVEFKDLHQCFNGDGTDVLHQIDPVKYRGQRGMVSMMPSDLSEIFRTKLEDWKEEHEYRVTELLTQCKFDEDKKIHLYHIDCKYISRIVVGWKCTPDRFKVIKENADVAGIDVVRLRMDGDGKIIAV